jgi:hypothetical protein
LSIRFGVSGTKSAGDGRVQVRVGPCCSESILAFGIRDRHRWDRSGAGRRAGAVEEGDVAGAGGGGDALPDRVLVADLQVRELLLLAGDRRHHEGHVAALEVRQRTGGGGRRDDGRRRLVEGKLVEVKGPGGLQQR